MQAQLLISALRRRTEFAVSACALDTASILQSVAAKVPPVALLSLNVATSAADTITALRHFHLSRPGIRKVLLVDAFDGELVVSAFRSGVRGIFCITDSSLRRLSKCLERVVAGQVCVNIQPLNHLLEIMSEVPFPHVLNSTGNNLLTPREEQVVALVAEGLCIFQNWASRPAWNSSTTP